MGAHKARRRPRVPKAQLVTGLAVMVALVLIAAGLSVATQPDGTPTGPPLGPVGAERELDYEPSGLSGFGRAPVSSEPPASEGPTTAPDSSGSGPGNGGAGRPPQPPQSGTILVGANVQTASGESWQEANARADATYGPLHMLRVFYPDLPPAWSNSRAANDGRPVVVSFKSNPDDLLSGRHDEHLANWFATAPRNQDIYWVYHHEPENNIESGEFSAASYRQAWQRVAGLAARADNPRLYPTLVLMCWTLESGSGRNWRDYYPGAEVIAVLGWDCYNSGGYRNGTYVDPERRFELAIATSRAEGKPWGIAEMGSRLVPGDESGERRGAWLRGIASHLNSVDYPPLWVAYFDSTTGGDFRLLDRPSQTAWQEFAESQGR